MFDMRAYKLVVLSIVFTVLCMSWWVQSWLLRFFRLPGRCIGLIPS